VFLAGPDDGPLVEASKKLGRPGLEVELTFNWDTEDYGEARYFGHLAYEVDDIYAACDKLMKAGVTINRPPRDASWLSCARPTSIPSNCCRKATRTAAGAVESMPNAGKW